MTVEVFLVVICSTSYIKQILVSSTYAGRYMAEMPLMCSLYVTHLSLPHSYAFVVLNEYPPVHHSSSSFEGSNTTTKVLILQKGNFE